MPAPCSVRRLAPIDPWQWLAGLLATALLAGCDGSGPAPHPLAGEWVGTVRQEVFLDGSLASASDSEATIRFRDDGRLETFAGQPTVSYVQSRLVEEQRCPQSGAESLLAAGAEVTLRCDEGVEARFTTTEFRQDPDFLLVLEMTINATPWPDAVGTGQGRGAESYRIVDDRLKVSIEIDLRFEHDNEETVTSRQVVSGTLLRPRSRHQTGA
ncbi:MAG: hypothetical protein JSV80_03930 [Acidobacteriota bacterium]|nr:MAG: hypothetical protein JSV80_03930 [Acidobacteriota bacterium]